MPRFRLREFLAPLHQPAVASDLRAGQIGQLFASLGGEVIGDPELVRGAEDIREKVPDDLLVHRRSHRDPGPFHVLGEKDILRGCRRPADELSGAGVFDKPVQEELRGFLQHGIGPFAQEGLVLVELIGLPKMPRSPGCAGWPHAVLSAPDRARPPPSVGRMVSDEAARAVVISRGLSASHAKVVEQVPQRLLHLGQIRHVCRPVVHLDVDVDVVVGVPRRGDLVVPNALQIRGHRVRPRRSHQQVAAELKVGCQKVWIGPARTDGPQARIDGILAFFLTAQFERDAIENRCVVRHARIAECGETGVLRRLEPSGRLVARLVSPVICCGGENQSDRIGCADSQGLAVGPHRAALGVGPQPRFESHAELLSFVAGAAPHEKLAACGRCRGIGRPV